MRMHCTAGCSPVSICGAAGSPPVMCGVRRKDMLAYPKPLHYLKPFDAAVLERVAAIRWLSKVGQSAPAQSEPALRYIADKQEAVRLITAPEWDDFRLEMRNEMTGFLANRWPQNYVEWNNSARALRGFFEAQVLPQLQAATDQYALPAEILADIRWDVVAFLQEEAFQQCQPPRFFDRLIRIYEQGHLPCSIEPVDSLAPNGTIIVC